MSQLRTCVWYSKLFLRSSLHKSFQKISYSVQADAESLYISPKVQELLKKITGFDLDKILKSRPVANPEPPKYKLLTDEQLQKAEEEAIQKAHKYLQMPPFKKAWDFEASKNQILTIDEDVAMFDKEPCSYVFTDISPFISKRERTVAVRENNGTLRLADNQERDRILQMYYPEPEKMIKMPEMFKDENLENLLGPDYYEYVLNRALMQFELDDPNYIRVTQRTYEHVLSMKQFDLLRSTRHFGPMAFYFTLHRKIDMLLSDMIDRDLIDDAVCLVQLYCLVNPECKTNGCLKDFNTDDKLQILEAFLNNDSKEKDTLNLALKSFMSRVNVQKEAHNL